MKKIIIAGIIGISVVAASWFLSESLKELKYTKYGYDKNTNCRYIFYKMNNDFAPILYDKKVDRFYRYFYNEDGLQHGWIALDFIYAMKINGKAFVGRGPQSEEAFKDFCRLYTESIEE